MADDIFIEDDASIEFEGEQLDRVQATERKRHAQITAAYGHLPADKRAIFDFIHEKIMAGKFDGPNAHNHITYLNQTRDIWVRQCGLRLGSEAHDG